MIKELAVGRNRSQIKPLAADGAGIAVQQAGMIGPALYPEDVQNLSMIRSDVHLGEGALETPATDDLGRGCTLRLDRALSHPELDRAGRLLRDLPVDHHRIVSR